ncbi:MAG: hypothetical protein HC901_00285 [Bdellovibrionaceae bacterium]|nr:hypothetical protein [Pseudobdellovibrionaceae bacterium]
MSDTELQTLRDFILRAASRFPRGITTTTLAISVAAAGFELPDSGPDALPAQLRYLAGKKLIEPATKAHTPSLETWLLTADGDDYLRTKRIP